MLLFLIIDMAAMTSRANQQKDKLIRINNRRLSIVTIFIHRDHRDKTKNKKLKKVFNF